jgi:Fe2+ or Zn2+ uptake regulation protein
MVDERGMAVLELLARTELALPPTPVYENLRLNGETFSKRTVYRKLDTLAEEGLVERVLDGKGYYQATDAGQEFVSEHR